MRAHQPGSTNTPAPTPAPAPERAPTKVPEQVPEKVIAPDDSDDPPNVRPLRAHGAIPQGNLIAQFGADIALPDLRHEIARCERHQKVGDACAIHYVGVKQWQLTGHSFHIRRFGLIWGHNTPEQSQRNANP